MRRIPTALATAACTVGLMACDEPPAGLLDALQYAMMGILMGCPGDPCDNTNELNLDVADTSDELDAKFDTLIANWCPTYTLVTDPIARGDEGTLRKGSTVRVNLSVFGQVSLTSEDVNGKVVARSDGWKTTINHTHGGPVEVGSVCPQSWPASQCKFRPAFDYTSNGDLSLTWVDTNGRHSESASLSDVLTYAPGTPITWCEDADHGAPRACGDAEEPQ